MRAFIFLAAGLLAAAVPAAGAAIQRSAPGAAPDHRWLPWLGCWRPLSPGAGDARPGRVCVSQKAGASAVEIVTTAEGGAAATRTLVADGEKRPVERGACRGWERARWSADGKRLFLRSELECDGIRRTASGVMAMVPPGEWLDVEVVQAGGEQATRVARHRPTYAAGAKAAGAAAQGARAAPAVEAARVAASGALSVEDVIEAVQQIAPAAVEQLILQRRNAFDLNSEALVSMADAGVPGDITDLMIALTYPEKFAISTATGTPFPRPAVDSDDEWDDDSGLPPATTVYGGYDPLSPYNPWRWGYGYDRWLDPYGYYAGGLYSSPYGWWYRSDRPTIVVVPRPSGTEEQASGRSEGKLVKGRGYTRSRSSSSSGSGVRKASPRTRPAPATSVRPAVTASRGSSSGSVRSSSPASSSSSSTGRKARPRARRDND